MPKDADSGKLRTGFPNMRVTDDLYNCSFKGMVAVIPRLDGFRRSET